MRAEFPIVRHARLTLSVRSPLSICSGKNEALVDTALVRDANGLPVLPGSSVAGALRSLVARELGDAAAMDLFGFANRQDGIHLATAARLHFSWGHIHDVNNRPVDGLVLDRAVLGGDPILAPLLGDKLPHRDHVRLGHRGSRQDKGKFDRTYVPAGHRFSLDLWLESGPDSDADDQVLWPALLGLLTQHGLRLGGATRRGYGEMVFLAGLQCRFDLRAGRQQADDLAAWSVVPVSLAAKLPKGYQPVTAAGTTLALRNWLKVEIPLQAEDFWRVGGGAISFGQHYEKEADARLYSERQVLWNDDGAGGERARLDQPRPVLPGASIKGALAHRTAFHAHRLAGRWADGSVAMVAPDTPCEEVQSLFGLIANTDSEGQSDGLAGRIFISDVRLSETGKVQLLQHNSLDRFTGGVRKGMLFSEEALFRTDITLCLEIDTRSISLKARQAFRLALEDLRNGRLPLGSGHAKGHGYFRGHALPKPLLDWLNETGVSA